MRHYTVFRLLIVLFGLQLASLAQAEGAAKRLPAGVTYQTSVEGISEYRLNNGLKVLLFPDTSKPTLTINITYLVGSRHENYGETGMAHLLEHLLFKGTPKHPKIPEEFKQRGARMNGTTSLDRTNYYEIVPASDDNLRWGIELEADRMVNSFIARKDLDSEMTVVRNEFEMGENRPGGVLFKRLQSLAYDWHSYGRSTIGNRSDIENVRIENLQAFYRTYYQPDNAVLILSGKFDPDQALSYVASSFGKIPKPTRKLPPEWTVEPTQDGERSFVVRRKGDQQLLMIAYKIPASLHADYRAVDIAGDILADVPGGRLHKQLVETGKATSVFASSRGGVAPGLQIFGAEIKKGDPVEPVRDALIEIVENFYKNPPSAKELAREKVQVEKQVELAFSDPESIGILLSEYVAQGDWRLFFIDRDEIANVTETQVAEAAGRYFRRDNRTVGIYLPEETPLRAEVPAAPELASVLKKLKVKAGAAAGEDFDPTPANIQNRTRLTQLGGLKLALLPKKTRGQTVSVVISFNQGDERSLFGKQNIASLAAGMISRGTTKMSREEIADALDRLKMSGGITEFQTTKENLIEALRLSAHVLRNPAFLEKEFEQIKKQSLSSVESQKSEPSALASEALSKYFERYPNGDWRHRQTIAERLAGIQAVTLDDVKAYYQDFYGASTGQVAIVGDFDPDLVVLELERLFGDWKSKQPHAPILDTYRDIAATRLVVDTPDKENAVYLARMNIDLKDDAPDYPALVVANYIFGGGPLSSRLGDRVRQKEGLSYSIGSGLSVSAQHNAGAWSVHAIAAPANIAAVDQAVREELARALKDGFTAEEVKSAVAGMLKLRQQNRAQDGGVARQWTTFLYLKRDFVGREAEVDKLIAAVTPESALAAARKYLQPEKLSTAIAADPAKKTGGK